MKKGFRFVFIVLSVIVGLAFGLIMALPFIQHKLLNNGSYQFDTKTDTIDFYYASTGHILIDVYFPAYEQTYPFVLDCGASNFLFSEHASKFDFNLTGFGIGKGPKGNWFTTRILRFGDIQIGNIQFKGINAQEILFPSDCPSEAVGLIGTGVMHHFDWQIDFENQQIVMAKTLNDLSLSTDTISIPVKVNSGSNHLIARYKFSKEKRSHGLLIDIGNSGSLLLNGNHIVRDSVSFNSLQVLGKSRKAIGEVESSAVKEEILWIDSIYLKGTDFMIRDIPTDVTPSALNLLGLGFFTNYKTTLSWSTQQVLLESYDSIPEYAWQTFGFRLEYDEILESTIIASIYEGASAHECGVPLNAQVVSIDTLPMTRLEDLCNYYSFTEKPDSINLKVQHNGLEQDFTLKKRWIFDKN